MRGNQQVAPPRNNRAIEISVHSNDNNGQKHGTFIGPPPKMRVDPGDTITWSLKVVPNDNGAEFSIQFLNGMTPLVDGGNNPVFQFGPTPGPVQYSVICPDPCPTEYAYQVFVFLSDGRIFSIDRCPLVDDSGN